jgi:hypothetical protein
MQIAIQLNKIGKHQQRSFHSFDNRKLAAIRRGGHEEARIHTSIASYSPRNLKRLQSLAMRQEFLKLQVLTKSPATNAKENRKRALQQRSLGPLCKRATVHEKKTNLEEIHCDLQARLLTFLSRKDDWKAIRNGNLSHSERTS